MEGGTLPRSIEDLVAQTRRPEEAEDPSDPARRSPRTCRSIASRARPIDRIIMNPPASSRARAGVGRRNAGPSYCPAARIASITCSLTSGSPTSESRSVARSCTRFSGAPPVRIASRRASPASADAASPRRASSVTLS